MISAIALVALAVLQALDAWTTRRILDAGGQELNPLMLRFMLAVGVMPALAIKSIAVIAAAWWFFMPYPLVLGAMVLVLAGVVLFNFRSIKR